MGRLPTGSNGWLVDVDPHLDAGQLSDMKTTVLTAIVLLAAPIADAAVHRTVTPKELAAAINKAARQLVPYRVTTMSPSDIREVRCIAPDEEPTEFRCKWRQRVRGGWVKRTTWLTFDTNGWRVMDA